MKHHLSIIICFLILSVPVYNQVETVSRDGYDG